MRNKMLSLILLFCAAISFSQSVPFYKGYDWEENPVYEKVANQTEEMFALKEKIVTEFSFEGEAFIEYFLEHKILWLNSDDKIEEYNKVYLPFSSNSSLEISKARVITKEGKVINLDDSKILTAADEETGRTYKYFAFEGITKGSYIEYIYVEKRVPRYRGVRLKLQGNYNKKNVSFDLFCPDNLVFGFKTINNLPEVTKKEDAEGKSHWNLQIDDLKKLEREEKSPYRASVGSLIYKLDANTSNNVSDISSYSKVSQNVYAYYYADLDKKTEKAVDAFIKELKLDKKETEEGKVRFLDFYIKNNIYLSETSDSGLSDIYTILDKKVTGSGGAIKLFVAVLRKLGIKHELVVTSDRREIKFDEEFESNNFLNDFLIYFPKTDKYLSPDKFETRFGFPPGYNTDNYGLFIKEVTIGNFKSALGKIKYIHPVKAEKSIDLMHIEVSFDPENLSHNKIHYERAFEGYNALFLQPYIHLVKGEEKEQLIEGIVKTITRDLEVTDRELINGKPELFGEAPLKFNVDFETDALVEKAGRKYLFKLGDIIGQQIQLYQEKKRVLPFEEEHQRGYYRKIVVNIPEGYKITNLDDINIHNSYTEDGKELFSFKSFYEVSGNKIIITADEFYRENIVKVPLYEEYRTVINSAADFNKIVLLLEKK